MNNEKLKVFIKKAIGINNDSVANFIIKQLSNPIFAQNIEGFYVEWKLQEGSGYVKICKGKKKQELIINHNRYN